MVVWSQHYMHDEKDLVSIWFLHTISRTYLHYFYLHFYTRILCAISEYLLNMKIERKAKHEYSPLKEKI